LAAGDEGAQGGGDEEGHGGEGKWW
jgi:hypothetical protein